MKCAKQTNYPGLFLDNDNELFLEKIGNKSDGIQGNYRRVQEGQKLNALNFEI
jgi:hypothetical protein